MLKYQKNLVIKFIFKNDYLDFKFIKFKNNI